MVKKLTLPQLKKYDVTSPAQLSKDKKKQFFNYIDKNYKAKNENVKENNIPHMCATHVEHGMWGSGLCVSGEHDIVEQEDGSFEVKHYTVEFEHGIEKEVPAEDMEIITLAEHGVTASKEYKNDTKLMAGRLKDVIIDAMQMSKEEFDELSHEILFSYHKDNYLIL